MNGKPNYDNQLIEIVYEPEIVHNIHMNVMWCQKNRTNVYVNEQIAWQVHVAVCWTIPNVIPSHSIFHHSTFFYFIFHYVFNLIYV